jgi:5S rRNA maturation endonuclease (ribonuclease M5)
VSATYERLRNALESHGGIVKETGTHRLMAQCPAHDDRNPSLSITGIEGSALLYCHAGCQADDVLVAIGLTKADLFDNRRDTTYEYPGGRKVHRKADKNFPQSGNKDDRNLFRADRLGEARHVLVVEGEKDVLAAESVGVVAVCSAMGAGKAHKADWTPLRGRSVTVVSDNDDAGRKHAADVAKLVTTAGALKVRMVRAAVGKDLADHIAAGKTIAELIDLGEATDSDPVPMSLSDAHDVFRRWLGSDYDTDALDAVLAAAAVECLDGDPLWLLLISGSGNAKTETVQALDGIGALISSTISSCGALLSATPKNDRAKDATGGLLRRLEPRGLLVIKDVTSILSMSGDARAEVLGALREVYDGRWSRNVGTDGGQTLEWTGRVAVVGAVTTAWDKAHAAIASMGDRFVLVRMDSTIGRRKAGRQAISNTGSETRMRAELAAAVAGVLAGMDRTPIAVTDAETDVLLAAADLVTLARTGVEYDYRGDVIDAHAPEMPTRFAKQLAQVVRGGVAIGMDRTEALRLAIRCARDSMPPLRLAIVDDIAEHPESSTAEVRKRIGKPRATADRQLQALHMLGVLECDEHEMVVAGKDVTRWQYRLAENIDPDALNPAAVPDLALHTPNPHRSREGERASVSTPPAKSGTEPPAGCTECGYPLTPGMDIDGMHPDCHSRAAARDAAQVLTA